MLPGTVPVRVLASTWVVGRAEPFQRIADCEVKFVPVTFKAVV